MFLNLFIVFTIIGSLTCKPVIVRNIANCSITDDRILHYSGQHSHTKFENECLSWSDLQTIYPAIINEANFFNDASIKEAKNYCRNPNMNTNGPWCFVQNEDAIMQEQCDVCQSLISKPTLPSYVEYIDETTTTATVSDNFFDNVRDGFKRIGIYVRDKVLEFVERIRAKFRSVG